MQQPLYRSQPRIQATTATSRPEPITTALHARALKPLRPVPPKIEGKNSGWMPQTEQPGEAPIRVVGSQGRRGILPSAPGRPVAPTAGTGAGKNTTIPVKDADGKFPCPHCTKTYLHAKHLKRHLLRHTGDRPYKCVLCRDTFTRSDILKRHFQKCSPRGNPTGAAHVPITCPWCNTTFLRGNLLTRHLPKCEGNPTGATHLSKPLDHALGNQKPAGGEEDMNHVNDMNTMPPSDDMSRPFDVGAVSDGTNNTFNNQNQLIRSSSMGNGDTPDRESMPGPGMGSSQRYPSDVLDSMTSQQMPYSMPYGQIRWPMYGGQQSSLDLSQMFQASAHQT